MHAKRKRSPVCYILYVEHVTRNSDYPLVQQALSDLVTALIPWLLRRHLDALYLDVKLKALLAEVALYMGT